MLEQELNKAQEHIAFLTQLAGTKINQNSLPAAAPSEKSKEENEAKPAQPEEPLPAPSPKKYPSGIETRVESILGGVNFDFLLVSS